MKRLVGDLRALGRWAPVRILREVLLRIGVTGNLLRLRARRLRAPRLRSPFDAGALPDRGTGWIAAGERVISGPMAFFGRDLVLGESPNWHTDADGYSWPVRPWWRIDLHGNEERDVKLVWEPARHRHLVVLARAAAESADGEAFMRLIEAHLRSWLRQNPPEIGVHWASNLELAVRALAWMEVVHLVGHRLDEEVSTAMAGHLYHSGSHIVADLPYTLSSMRNNHLIGDAVGLVAIGKAFPSDRRARRWVRLGDRLLRRHVPRHVREDGSSLEDSVGYRGFVAELLVTRVALGDAPPEVTAALGRARRHLIGLGAGAGPVPHFGDWDGGSAFAGTPGQEPPESSVAMAGSILGVSGPATPVKDGSDAGGGIGRVASGPWTVWLKAGAGESHEHADLTSVDIRHGDTWVIGDPGNGSYNRTRGERDYFRTSVAHDVLTLDGQDQRVPHRRFRWRFHPEGVLGHPFDLGAYRVMWAEHDAFERFDPPRTVLRACLVSSQSVVVADWLVGGASRWRLSIPLGPDIEHSTGPAASWEGPGTQGWESTLLLPDGSKVGLLLPARPTSARGTIDPYDGWWAVDYDVVRPATRLEAGGFGAGPVVWAVWLDGRPDLTIGEDLGLAIDGLRIHPTHDGLGNALIVGEVPEIRRSTPGGPGSCVNCNCERAILRPTESLGIPSRSGGDAVESVPLTSAVVTG